MGSLKKENNLIKQKIYGERNILEIYEFFKPQGKVLDLGTGRGLHFKNLLSKGYWAVGIDRDFSSLKKLGIKNLVCADATCLPFRDGVFDSVLCIELLEHLAKPQDCIREVTRILKSQARACFTAPCLNIPLRKIVPFYRKLLRIKFEGGRHLHIFSTKALVSMFREIFWVEKIRYRDFTILFKRLFSWAKFIESFDIWLSKIVENITFLKLFAGANFIIVRKR